jgi:hypothetical protein
MDVELENRIVKALKDRGYRQSKTKLHIFWKEINEDRCIIDLRRNTTYAYRNDLKIDAPEDVQRDLGQVKAMMDNKQTRLF